MLRCLRPQVCLFDIFLQALFEIDPDKVDSDEVAHAMNIVLEESNERVKRPMRRMKGWLASPFVSSPFISLSCYFQCFCLFNCLHYGNGG